MITTIPTTQNILDICTKSTYSQRDGDLNYYYVYLHIINEVVIYVGQGSHNRAYRSSGKSAKWNEVYNQNPNIVIHIEQYNMPFQESLLLEKTLIEKYQETIVNESYGHSPNESFPVLCFTLKGELVKRYSNCEETSIDGFNAKSVRVNCNQNQNRSTYKDLIWCYEKDYELFKDRLFILGVTCRKPVEVTFPDGTVKIYTSVNSTKEDGLLPSKVREVLMGTRKSHKSCSYKYIE